MAVADRIIPRNAVVVGAAKIQGERLGIEITSLEHDGTIIPVELEVYDTDGQPGIFIPNSMEMNAVREVAANMGGSLGSRGPVDQLKKLREEHLKIQLTISLHAATQSARNRIIPHMRIYGHLYRHSGR